MLVPHFKGHLIFFHYLLMLRLQNWPGLTHVTLGGGADSATHPAGFSPAKKRGKYRHETFSIFSRINLTSSIKSSGEKSVEKILRKCEKGSFCVKSGKRFGGFWNVQVWRNTRLKTTNTCNWPILKMLSWIFDIFLFWTQHAKKSRFQKQFIKCKNLEL